MKKKAFLFDGNSFCYRAFYAIAHLSNSRGEPTNAIYGFLTMVRKIIKDEQPDYIAICFDRPEKTFRHKQYAEYKIHRKPMPDELAVQIPRIKEVIEAHNITMFEKAGYEADDILGTLARELSEQKIDVFIVTGDKDALQLVNDTVKVYSAYRDRVTIYDRAKVKERFDTIGPEHVVDIMALMGDASDNIPGVPGIGEKTAVALINEFGSLEKLFQHVNKVKSPSKRALLEKHRAQAALSKELATIDCAVPMTVTLDELTVREPNEKKLFELYKELEFKSLLHDVAATSVQSGVKKNYHCITTEPECAALLKKLKKADAFAFDTETTSADPFSAALVGVSFSMNAGEAYYIALSHAGIATKKGVPLKTAIKLIKPFLEDSSKKKYGQNIKYDALVLSQYGITIHGIAFDTMVASYVINPAKMRHNLDNIALEYLQIKKISFESLVGTGRKQVTIDTIDSTRVSEYACEDADCVFQLVPLLTAELKKRNSVPLFQDIEMPLVSVLIAMELNGVTVDVALLKKLSNQCADDLEKLTKKIHTIAGEEFNINSPKQLSALLFEKLKLPVVKKTKTGYSTDVGVLETLAEDHVIARHLLEYREYSKLKSTYLDALPELINPTTGCIHTSYNQTITATGRLSSSNPNVQNIPIKAALGKEIRKAFIPREKNRVILSADYSQIELRLLAHFSGDEKLINAFCHKKDIHQFTATLLYDVTAEDVTSDMRTVAKVVNFSIIYGKTPFGLSRDLGIAIAEAKSFIDAYFKRYKKIKTYLESLKDEARTQGFVTTILGRRAYFPDINSTNATVRQFAERAAMNAPLQGSAADLIKKAMIAIHAAVVREHVDAHMILQVHDELVFDVAEKEVKRTTALVKKLMESALELKVPLVVDITTGNSWAK